MFIAINVHVIDHKDQRYDTVGDYYEEDGVLEVRISHMGNWKYHLLVLIHELVEYFMCRDAGITEEEITAFDKEFEKNRKPGNTDEPGHDPASPYGAYHKLAEVVERCEAWVLGVDWKEYSAVVESL